MAKKDKLSSFIIFLIIFLIIAVITAIVLLAIFLPKKSEKHTYSCDKKNYRCKKETEGVGKYKSRTDCENECISPPAPKIQIDPSSKVVEPQVEDTITEEPKIEETVLEQPKRYSCKFSTLINRNKCVEDINGDYGSIDICQNNCDTAKYITVERPIIRGYPLDYWGYRRPYYGYPYYNHGGCRGWGCYPRRHHRPRPSPPSPPPPSPPSPPPPSPPLPPPPSPPLPPPPSPPLPPPPPPSPPSPPPP